MYDMCFICMFLVFVPDIPGTDYRIATIAGPGEACVRAKKMVEEIVAEVREGGRRHSAIDCG